MYRAFNNSAKRGGLWAILFLIPWIFGFFASSCSFQEYRSLPAPNPSR